LEVLYNLICKKTCGRNSPSKFFLNSPLLCKLEEGNKLGDVKGRGGGIKEGRDTFYWALPTQKNEKKRRTKEKKEQIECCCLYCE
jgi:hypothetical protein